MKSRIRFAVLGTVVSLSFVALAWSQEAASHARVVRLSFVEGTVTLQRPDVTEWSTAPVNTPIEEGFKLATAEDGYAEVEFENGSAARLGQNGLLEFTQLALTSSGAKLNGMTLGQGYASFSIKGAPDDVNELKAGDASLEVPSGESARFRADLEDGALRVEVFKGSVSVSSPEGSQELSSDMVLGIQPGTDQAFVVSNGITRDDWDKWVEERENELAASLRQPAPGLGPSGANSYMYGWNDLNAYGNWAYVPGYGYGWYPAGVSAGWVPYSFGRWAWYPGNGWVWISGEPWGWLPYHFGEWVFYPGIGWVWIPDDFSGWFGADVVWFEGPGWFGWCPASVVPSTPASSGRHGHRVIRGGPILPSGCPSGEACGIIVHRKVVEGGLAVNKSSIIGTNIFDGNPMPKPVVGVRTPVILPGSPAPAPSAAAGRRVPAEGRVAPGAGGRPVTVTMGKTPSGGSRIVYDSATGQFVNDPNRPPVAVTAPQPAPAGMPRTEAGAPAATEAEGKPAPFRAEGAPTWQRTAPRTDTPVARPTNGETRGEMGSKNEDGGRNVSRGSHSGSAGWGGGQGTSSGASHSGGPGGASHSGGGIGGASHSGGGGSGGASHGGGGGGVGGGGGGGGGGGHSGGGGGGSSSSSSSSSGGHH